jgi:tetratricopeptide (TPR) repeat protein
MIDIRGPGICAVWQVSPRWGGARARLIPGLLLACLLLAVPAAAAERIDEFLPLVQWEESQPEVQANRQFIDNMVELAGSPQAAARQLMDNAWEYVRKRNTVRALRRFNQAYLLNPASAEAHWGLGTVASQLGRPQAALRLLMLAQALQERKEAALLADIAFAHIQLAQVRHDDKAAQARELEAALAWLDRAERVDARSPLVWANRAIIHYYQGEYLAAWRDVERAEALDKGDVDPRIIRELTAKMPRPVPAGPLARGER